jgi:hypothetical protein
MIGDSSKAVVFNTKVGTIRNKKTRKRGGERKITRIDDFQ